MNHLLGPYACRRPHWWSPRRRGRRTRARNIPGRNFSMAPKNIQMAAMDSPLFGYVVFYFLLKLHLVEETFVAQKKCAYYQSGTQFSIKTLSSTNVWLTWIKWMVNNEYFVLNRKMVDHLVLQPYSIPSFHRPRI